MNLKFKVTDESPLLVILEVGGTLVYRDACGRIIVGNDADGRAGGDLVGGTKEPPDNGK